MSPIPGLRLRDSRLDGHRWIELFLTSYKKMATQRGIGVGPARLHLLHPLHPGRYGRTGEWGAPSKRELSVFTMPRLSPTARSAKGVCLHDRDARGTVGNRLPAINRLSERARNPRDSSILVSVPIRLLLAPDGPACLLRPGPAGVKAGFLVGGRHLFATQLEFLAEVIEGENPFAEQEREHMDDELIEQPGLAQTPRHSPGQAPPSSPP